MTPEEIEQALSELIDPTTAPSLAKTFTVFLRKA